MRHVSETLPGFASTAPDASAASGSRLLYGLLGAGAAALFLGAGGLLWWRHGDAVFSDFALSGLAWCF